eukprot:TRINITY_DN1128_c0_g1_i3.p1 TRINITY_DN1128_c0_g1~~TRINITY_DN1128_c0_g1_i3.p1  ORF type:complete len:265 (+),score=82.02 TRINITY_DN1128_c0_g1_i3:81-875(+)
MSRMHVTKVFPVVFGGSLLGVAYKSWGGGHEERAKVYDGIETDERLSINWWDDKWSLRQTSWRRGEATDPQKTFDGNIEVVRKLLETEPVVKNGKAFVPLCGDSKVVPYLAAKGMSVVCVEGSENALKRLREEIATHPQAVQDRITVIEGDFFTASLPEADIDFIYDRGSLVAIDPARRGEYFAAIQKVSKPGTICYLEGIMRNPAIDGNLQTGPPHHLPLETVTDLYKGWNLATVPDHEEGVKAQLVSDEVPHGFYPIAMAKI